MAGPGCSRIDKASAEMVRTEYVTGDLSVQQLANKYDLPHRALKERAVRGKWATERDQYRTNQRIGKETEKILASRLLRSPGRDCLSKLSTDALLTRSREFADRLCSDAESALDTLTVKPMPDSWEGLLLREQVVTSVQRRGRTAFGLDAATGGTTNVMVHVQSDLASGSVKQLPASDAEVIDVESVPSGVAPRE